MRVTAPCLAFSLILLASPVVAAGPFDGVYRGTYTPAGNGNVRCPEGGSFSVTVTDGKFTYGGSGEGERVVANVGADGSFTAQSGQRFLRGRIDAGQMSASTAGGRCNYIWSLKK